MESKKVLQSKLGISILAFITNILILGYMFLTETIPRFPPEGDKTFYLLGLLVLIVLFCILLPFTFAAVYIYYQKLKGVTGDGKS